MIARQPGALAEAGAELVFAVVDCCLIVRVGVGWRRDRLLVELVTQVLISVAFRNKGRFRPRDQLCVLDSIILGFDVLRSFDNLGA
ncbi:MAG: hypothetical protein ABSH34_14440 [Verrucomicrobiota bacterium]|jgi:hypothetical protein